VYNWRGFRGAIPSAFYLKAKLLFLKKKILMLLFPLSDDEYLIFDALQQQSSLKVQDIMSILNKKNIFPIVQKLITKGLISLNEEMVEEYKPNSLDTFVLQEEYSSNESLMNFWKL
jgi:primosomal protein N' (replication factor Y)